MPNTQIYGSMVLSSFLVSVLVFNSDIVGVELLVMSLENTSALLVLDQLFLIEKLLVGTSQ